MHAVLRKLPLPRLVGNHGHFDVADELEQLAGHVQRDANTAGADVDVVRARLGKAD